MHAKDDIMRLMKKKFRWYVMYTRDDLITETIKFYKEKLKEEKNVPACIDSHR